MDKNIEIVCSNKDQVLGIKLLLENSVLNATNEFGVNYNMYPMSASIMVVWAGIDNAPYFYITKICDYYKISDGWIQCTALEFIDTYNYVMNTPIK